MMRMNTIQKISSLFFLLPLLLSACVREQWPQGTREEVVISFRAETSDNIVFSTKSSLGLNAESSIFNMYVFVFEGDDKIFGQYFDYSNKHLSGATPTSGNWWTVSNNTPSDGTTTGEIHMKLPSNSDTADKTIVAISNIDAEMVNISTADLQLIDNLSKLETLTAKLRQQITSRSGYFPMCGIKRNITIVDGISLSLKRLDAKIQFNVQVAPGSNITKFSPLKWRVVNLPSSAFVVERTDGNEKDHSDTGDSSSPSYKDDFFFDWGDANFETESSLYKGRLRFELLINGGTKKVTVTEAPDADVQVGDGTTKKYVEFNGTKYPMFAKPNATKTWVAVVDYDDPSGFLLYDYSENKTYGGKGELLEFGIPYGIYSADQSKISILSPTPTYGFSFYMLESRKTPATKSGWTYADREKQTKDATTGKNGDFLYAPKYAPYVEITGELEIEGYGDPLKPTPLTADVKYLVHLGNFGNENNPNYSNFSIERNHTYTYNIFINGIEDIKAEVTEKDTTPDAEVAPGATGDITISQEHTIICDSHYSSHVITIHKDNIDASKITWRVKTPFCDGGPDNVDIANTSGYDCQWVEFRLNQKVSNVYSTNRMPYLKHAETIDDPATQSMSIPQFVQFLKDAKQNTNGYGAYFDNNDCITATVFVDEYYYEKHPIDNTVDDDLWKQFVNQPMRSLDIIYSGVTNSKDGESRVTGSTFSIMQHSIQTVYDITNPNIHQAWGFEYLYDDGELAQENGYYTKEQGEAKTRNNRYSDNGLRNTMIEWELTTTNDNRFNNNSKKQWSTFMDGTTPDNTSLLLEDYRYPRYSCMSRNRDNNGNNDIDANEVRWYMATYNQLVCLFLGANGFDKAARLYQRSAADQASSDVKRWRQHYLASDKGGGNSDQYPRIVWVEEGTNGSDRWYDWTTNGQFGKSGGKYSIRCLRNLGSYTDETQEPEPLIEVRRFIKNDDGTETEYTTTGSYSYQGAKEFFYFDCSRVNKNSLRFFTDRELVLHDEHDEVSNLYQYFETAPANKHPKIDNTLKNNKNLPGTSGNGYDYRTLDYVNWYLDQDEQPNPFCPEGYRLPNLREVTLMLKFAPETSNNYFTSTAYGFTRTHWSLRHKVTKTWGSIAGAAKIMMGNADQKTDYVRCVKDDKTPRP